jgi:hypothetical protein
VRNICAGEKHIRREVIKRHNINNDVSREDTRGSRNRVVEKEVRSPWIIRDVVESSKDEV